MDMDSKELIGKLRASCELYSADVKALVRTELALELRMMGDAALELIDDAVVAYVADVAVSRELYTDTMRRRVTAAEVLALLTYALGTLSSAHPHHYALALGWWGDRLCATLFDHEARLIYPISEMLYAWFPQHLEAAGIDFFELEHICDGETMANVSADGVRIYQEEFTACPWYTQEFEQFLRLSFQTEAGGFYYELDPVPVQEGVGVASYIPAKVHEASIARVVLASDVFGEE